MELYETCNKMMAIRSFARRGIAQKVFASSDEAVFDVFSGSKILVSGFGLCGVPENLLRAIHKRAPKDLSIYTNTSGTAEFGPGMLITSHFVKAVHTSYVGGNPELERQYLQGEIELDLIPQGSLAERLRAGGAGLSAFYTHTGAGTLVEDGGFPIKFSKDGRVETYSKPREVRIWGGKKYLLEEAINGDFSIIKAWKADPYGNLIYKRTARNFNPDMAAASTVTIAEVEEIVPAGSLDPDKIHTPGIYVNRVVKGEFFGKPIEKPMFFSGDQVSIPGTPEQAKVRERIAKRAAREVKDGMTINLGIGMPTLIPNYVDKKIKIILHSENGLLGIGPYPKKGEEDADLINAGKETVTTIPGSSCFCSSISFGIVRGDHLDLTILGGLQVSEQGDLSNWIVPGKMVKGMGGAMDLVDSQTKCIVLMEHTNKKQGKVLPKNTLPLTGKKVVRLLITDMGVFEFRRDTGMNLIEIAPDITVDELKKLTPAKYNVASDLKQMLQ